MSFCSIVHHGKNKQRKSGMSEPTPGFPTHGFDSPQKITDSIQIITCLEPETHIISYGPQDVSSRIIGSIIYVVFASIFSGVPLYFGIHGWSKLFERPFEEAGMVVAVALLIGICFPALFLYAKYFGSCSVRHFSPYPDRVSRSKNCFYIFPQKKFIEHEEIKYFQMQHKED